MKKRNRDKERGGKIPKKKEETATRSCRCFIASGFVVLTDTCAGMRGRGRSKTGGARDDTHLPPIRSAESDTSGIILKQTAKMCLQ